MAAMEILETDEWWEEDDGVSARRARARSLLPKIVQQVKQALDEAGIGTEVFVVIPETGNAIATFGTMSDPPNDVWLRVRDIVSSIVRETIGSGRLWFREVTCATTADQLNPADTPTPMRSLD